GTRGSEPTGARGPAHTTPVTSSDDSCGRWSASAKTASATSAFDITRWSVPVPSRTWRKWRLPLERRAASQPRTVTVRPSCSPVRSTVTTLIRSRLADGVSPCTGGRHEARVPRPRRVAMLGFRLSEEQESFRLAVRSFAERELGPRVEELEASESFPMDLFRQLGSLGYLGVGYPEDFGVRVGDVVGSVLQT